MRDLRGSYKGISEFYLKILQNSGIMVDQRARNMALDLTVLSFNCSQDPSDGYKPHGGR
jgi:hypothetical protein